MTSTGADVSVAARSSSAARRPAGAGRRLPGGAEAREGHEGHLALHPGQQPAADGREQAALGLPGLADDPLRGPVAAFRDDLERPAPRGVVIPGEARALGQDLPRQPSEEVLLDLPDDPLHFPLRLGPVRPTGALAGAE